ncbi:hypothetical protein O6H91_21G053200 [Diphasiastrum complanatum]|uniref:Uncharacterized protein n=1 Tax=Diphasiastrum complanatum TaxID=34168 RepID=A0ACC2AKN6_DIPCM|nr:hypothetical protein O6H91_21G053200 [Diphasiastrum complanatum]
MEQCMPQDQALQSSLLIRNKSRARFVDASLLSMLLSLFLLIHITLDVAYARATNINNMCGDVLSLLTCYTNGAPADQSSLPPMSMPNNTQKLIPLEDFALWLECDAWCGQSKQVHTSKLWSQSLSTLARNNTLDFHVDQEGFKLLLPNNNSMFVDVWKSPEFIPQGK